jgi:hypothetical protein
VLIQEPIVVPHPYDSTLTYIQYSTAVSISFKTVDPMLDNRFNVLCFFGSAVSISFKTVDPMLDNRFNVLCFFGSAKSRNISLPAFFNDVPTTTSSL